MIAILLVLLSTLTYGQIPLPWSVTAPPSTTGVWNLVGDFGGIGDNESDNTVKLQAAFNTLCMNVQSTGLGQTLQIPNGIFLHFAPVVVPCKGVTVEGNGRDSSIIRGSGYNGAGIVVLSPNAVALPLSLSLVAGSPGSLALTGKTSGSVNLSDVSASIGSAAFLDGLSQFDVRSFVNVSVYDPNNEDDIIASHGNPFPDDPISGIDAFQLGTTFNKQWFCSLDVSGKEVRVTGPFSTGAHLLECSWDSFTVRLFVDGVLVGSTNEPVLGLLSQSIYQDVNLGTPWGFANSGPAKTTITGSAGPVEISDVARHTVNYTPEIESFSVDGHTLVIWDGSGTFGTSSVMFPFPKVFTTLKTKNKPVINVYHMDFNAGTLQMGPLNWRDLQLDCLQVTGAPQSTYERMNFSGPCPVELDLQSNDYVSHLRQISFAGSSGCRSEMQMSGAGAGIIEAMALNFNGCAVQLASSGDTSIGLYSTDFVPNSETFFSALLQPASNVGAFYFIGTTFDSESGLLTGRFKSFVGASGSMNLQFNGGSVAPVSGPTGKQVTYPLLWNDKLAGVAIRDFSILLAQPPSSAPGANGLPQAWVHFIGPVRSPVIFDNVFNTNPGPNIPLTDVVGGAAITMRMAQ